MPTEESSIRKLNEQNENPEVFFVLKLSIKNTDVQNISIVDIVVREWIFDYLPRIEIKLSDNGRFVDQIPLEDNDEIEIEINNFSTQDPPIKNSFTLQDWEIVNSGPGKAQQALIVLTGLLKSTNMTYPIKTRIFSSKNSEEVFRQIAFESNLDFESKIKAKDKMNWIQIDQSNYNFIEHVLERSYVENNDVPFLYTTRKGKMVYTSLNTELRKTQDIKRFIFNIKSGTLNSGTFPQDELEDFLEEEIERDGENAFYFYNWKFKNMGGFYNKTNSYGRSFNYYDKTNFIHRKITTDNHPLTIHSLKDKSKIGNIVDNDTFGMLDNSNVHENYALAMVQNKYLKDNFFGSYLIVYSRPTDRLNLFDIVDVKLPSMLPIEANMDEVHSGKYVVGGILHTVSKNSIYNTVVILFRNGMDIKGYLKNFESKHSSSPISDAKIFKEFVPSTINILGNL